MIWDRLTGPGTHFEFNHAEIEALIVQQSPFVRMLRHGIAEQRYDLSSPAPEHEVPVFEELRRGRHDRVAGSCFPPSASSRRRSAGRPRPSESTSYGSSAR